MGWYVPCPPRGAGPRGTGGTGRGRGGPGGRGTPRTVVLRPPPGSVTWRWRCEGRGRGGPVLPGGSGGVAARTPPNRCLALRAGALPGEKLTGENEGFCPERTCLGRTSLLLAHSLSAVVSLPLLQEPAIGLASSVQCLSLGTPSARRRPPPGNGPRYPTCTW